MRIIVLIALSCFLNQSLQAAFNFRSFAATPCKQSLGSQTFSQDLESLRKTYSARLLGPNGKSRSMKLRLLEELLRNPTFLEACERNQYQVASILNEATKSNGDFLFTNAAIELLERVPGDAAKQTRIRLGKDTAPKDYQNAASYSDEIFQDKALSDKSRAQAISFTSYDPNLSSQNLTRRMYGFMALNSTLDPAKKINFIRNISQAYQKFQHDQGIHKEDVFYFNEYDSLSGDQSKIFCAHRCSFYFVIDKDGNFFSAKSKKDHREESTDMVLNDWRKSSAFIYKAGEESPIQHYE